jgi:hypothetical protein
MATRLLVIEKHCKNGRKKKKKPIPAELQSKVEERRAGLP